MVKWPEVKMRIDGSGLSFVNSVYQGRTKRASKSVSSSSIATKSVNVKDSTNDSNANTTLSSEVTTPSKLDKFINDMIPAADIIPPCVEWHERELSSWLGDVSTVDVCKKADKDIAESLVNVDTKELSAQESFDVEEDLDNTTEAVVSSNSAKPVFKSLTYGEVLRDRRQVLVLLREGSRLHRAWIMGEGYRTHIELPNKRKHRVLESVVEGLLQSDILLENSGYFTLDDGVMI